MTISNVGSVPNSNQTAPADGFNQLLNDFKSLGTDIQSGDLTSAQSAFAAFQNDLQSGTGTNPLSQLFSNNSTLSNDLTALQTALKSNDPTSAQNAFKSLIQDLQSAMKTQMAHRHHHHHHVNDSDESSNSTSNLNSITYASTSASKLDAQA